MIKLISGILSLILISTPAHAENAEVKRDWPTEAKFRLEATAQCIVATSEEKVGRLLSSDFTSSSYKKGLEQVATNNRNCWRKNRLRASYGLPLAGALAEAMLEREQRSLVSRLVQASATQPQTYSPSDQLASCVVRKRPGISASLFGTDIGSDAEREAVSALRGMIGDCAKQAGFQGKLQNIRYLLATASYRLVAAHESQVEANA